MNSYQRIFGTGPRGLLVSTLLLLLSYKFEGIAGLPEIHSSKVLGISVFSSSIVLTLALLIWSVRSLSPTDRGRKLITSGAFRFFRHPLYAAFLSFFNFGLAILLNNYIYLVWALLQHIVWHLNVLKEEQMVEGIFKEEYEEYCKNTGRFFPKIRSLLKKIST